MLDNPYSSPQADVEAEAKSSKQQSTIGKLLAIVGAILLLALPIGLISTIYELITISGNGDRELFAELISQALVPTVLGLVFGICAVPVLFVAIVVCGYRRPWLYHAIKIFAFFVLLIFPVGTVIGIVTLLVLRKRKARYFN